MIVLACFYVHSTIFYSLRTESRGIKIITITTTTNNNVLMLFWLQMQAIIT